MTSTQQEIIHNLTKRIKQLENLTSHREESPPIPTFAQTAAKKPTFIPAIPIDPDGNTQIEEKSLMEPQPLDWVKVVTKKPLA